MMPTWVYVDIRCWHWPSFTRDVRDGDGNLCPDEYELLIGPIHVFRAFLDR